MAYGDGVWLVVVSVAGEFVPLVRAVVRPCPATVHCCCAVEDRVGASVVNRTIRRRLVAYSSPSSPPTILNTHRAHASTIPETHCVHYP